MTTRAVSFRLSDPERLMLVLSKIYELHLSAGGRSAHVAFDSGGRLYWERGRGACSPGSIGYSLKRKAFIFEGVFFEDCWDEVVDVCRQLGHGAELKK